MQRVIVGSDDEGIKALKIYTTQNKYKVGNVYSCEYIAENDQTNTNSAIIGFHLVFNDTHLCDFSVFVAPILKKFRPALIALQNSATMISPCERIFRSMKGPEPAQRRPDRNNSF